MARPARPYVDYRTEIEDQATPLAHHPREIAVEPYRPQTFRAALHRLILTRPSKLITSITVEDALWFSSLDETTEYQQGGIVAASGWLTGSDSRNPMSGASWGNRGTVAMPGAILVTGSRSLGAGQTGIERSPLFEIAHSPKGEEEAQG